MRGRIDPGDNHLRPQCVGAADVWKDRRSGGCTMSSPGTVGHMNWGFYIVGGGIDTGDYSSITFVCWSCQRVKRFLIRGCDLIFKPGGAGSTNATLEYPNRRRRYRLREPPFSSPVLLTL